MTLELGLLAAAVVVPSLLIAVTPRRWTGRAMLGWVVSPLIAYVGVVAWEGLTRPAQTISAQNFLLGFSLLSAIFIVPWGLACAAGFAIGFGLRPLIRRPGSGAGPTLQGRTPPAGPSSRAPAPETPPPSLPPDVSPDAAEWRPAHVSFENDGLEIGGLGVWTHTWRAVDAAPLHLAHPAHPDETHRFRVQEIVEGSNLVRFAVSEVSNGVWGFYVPRYDVVEAWGSSADGSLRYEHRKREHAERKEEAPASWAVLLDAATGHVLADGSAWTESRISGNADGSLFLRLRDDTGETLFRIDPTARTYRNQGEPRGDFPLLTLPDAIEHARREGARPGPGARYRRISPDGAIRVDSEAVEWGNSHWVHTPRVIDTASGRVLLDLWNTDWDATVSWSGPRRVSLDFSRYHFSGDLTIELDLANESYRITREPGGDAELPSGPLAEAASAMEASGRRVAAFAAGHGAARPVWDDGKPGPFAALRTALVILVTAAVLIAAATWLSMTTGSQPPGRPKVLRSIPSAPVAPARPKVQAEPIRDPGEPGATR